jgi:hypothetical protein
MLKILAHCQPNRPRRRLHDEKTKKPWQGFCLPGLFCLPGTTGYGMSCEGIVERIEESEFSNDMKAAMGRSVTILM